MVVTVWVQQIRDRISSPLASWLACLVQRTNVVFVVVELRSTLSLGFHPLSVLSCCLSSAGCKTAEAADCSGKHRGIAGAGGRQNVPHQCVPRPVPLCYNTVPRLVHIKLGLNL